MGVFSIIVTIVIFVVFVVIIINLSQMALTEKSKKSPNPQPFTSDELHEHASEEYETDTTFIIAGTGHRGSDVKEAIVGMASVPAVNLSRCRVKLLREPFNEYDEFAVRIMIEGIFFGYVPRYMSEEISTGIANKIKYECRVDEILDQHGVVMSIKG